MFRRPDFLRSEPKKWVAFVGVLVRQVTLGCVALLIRALWRVYVEKAMNEC
jgi:hypothetical protein